MEFIALRNLHKYKRRFQQGKLIQLANLMLARFAFSLLFVSDFFGVGGNFCG
jgi:hypothetical protein